MISELAMVHFSKLSDGSSGLLDGVEQADPMRLFVHLALSGPFSLTFHPADAFHPA